MSHKNFKSTLLIIIYYTSATVMTLYIVNNFEKYYVFAGC